MEEQLAGTIAPVLSVSLCPGESIVAEAGEFSWMTDSIQMTADSTAATEAGPDGGTETEQLLSTFTAKGTAGNIAFACKQPGRIMEVTVGPGTEYLVHRHGFMAGTPGVRVRAGFRQSFSVGIYSGEGFGLQRVSGDGRAWIELAGDAVRIELAVGESLRAHPGHVGMFAASAAFQLVRVPGITNRYFGPEAHHFAVLSGPGTVWLQSMPKIT